MPWTFTQKALYTGSAVGAVIFALSNWHGFALAGSIVLLFACSLIIGLKVVAILAGLIGRNTESAAADVSDDALPVYSVLVPMFREAAVVDDLIAALGNLDYPRDRLNAQILLEENDDETRSRLHGRALPSWLDVTVVPPGEPRTKPRACNHGLARARGEFLVVYDAEDRPEPDQLRKAVANFRALPDEVVCLQAKLNFYNRFRNLITRWFTLEYTAWFDLYLPGLHALGAPIPLGGTSNHFRTRALQRLGGWDAYNVTEDCDLGIRLECQGMRTRVLDSTTWEEAPCRWDVWLKQRSRWMKGYWQTHLVHTQQPMRVLKELGAWKFLLMLLTVGGQVASLLINPICWTVAGCWAVGQWSIFDPNRPWTLIFVLGAVTLLLINALFVLMYILGAMQRRFHALIPYAPLMPLYWIMLSLGAWRGFLQFFNAPFIWEKTPHGLDKERAKPAPTDFPAEPLSPQRALGLAVVALTVAVVGLIAWRTPVWMHYDRQIEMAAIRLDQPAMSHEIALDASWLNRERMTVDVAFADPSRAAGVFRAVIHLKVWDEEWYEVETSDISLQPGGVRLNADLTTGWKGIATQRPWTPDCLRRVRAAGVRLFGAGDRQDRITIAAARAWQDAPLPELAARVINAPLRARQNEMLQVDFDLNRHYANPFDPDEIDVWAEVTDPAGAVTRVPAFYTQDYARRLDGTKEILTAAGAPRWAARITPRTPGHYRWRVAGKDRDGRSFTGAAQAFDAAASNARGFVRIDADPRFFSFDNGDFFYPVCMNIRSPTDAIAPAVGRYPIPDPDGGSFVMDDFLERMAKTGINMGRTWMSPWWAGLEWDRNWPGYHGLGVYNLRNAWRIDRLLETASKNGQCIEFALNSHGPFISTYDAQWQHNPLNARNGGPAANQREVFMNPESKRRFRNRFRYIAARYGANPAVFGWVVWIEVNSVHPDPGEVVPWHREMTAYLREVDLDRHIISTEFCGGPENFMPGMWDLPDIDYTQVAAYSNERGLIGTFRAACRGLVGFKKPIILEEYGGCWIGGDSKWIAQELHDGLWAGWMFPLSATPMAWWWNFIFAHDLTRHHQRFAAYIAGEDLRGVEWKYQRVTAVDGAPNLAAMSRSSNDHAFIWVYAPAITSIVGGPGETGHMAFGSRTYLSRAGSFDALKPDPGSIIAVDNARLNLDSLALAPGHYDVEFWDTWIDAKSAATLEISGANDVLPLPKLTRDVAIKIMSAR